MVDTLGLKTFIIIFVFAVSLTTSEIIRGYCAYLLGDRYGYVEKRLTTNPLELIDFFGTIVLPLVLILCNSPIMGASCHPVRIDFSRIKFGKLGGILAILAKPFSEFLLCAVSLLLLRFSRPDSLAMDIFQVGVFLNAFLVAISLLPILPFSGGQLVSALLPPRLRYTYEQHAPYSFFIILLLFLVLPYVGINIMPVLEFVAMHIIAAAFFLVQFAM